MQASPKHGIRSNGLFLLILLIFSALIFFPIFLPRDNTFLKTISVLARYNNTRFLPVVGLLLLGALSIRDQRASMAAAALVIFPVFALALNGLWAGAYSENNVIAGLIPRTDAFSFYGSAVTLIETGFLTGYSKRRPLFGGLLAFLLWITAGNLQVTLALLTYLLALVTFFSVLELRKLIGQPAAMLYFMILFLFLRKYIGITMSENMGGLLGITAFTLFLIFLQTPHEDRKKQIMYFLSSAFVFALAQTARPGAIATLPFLILFVGWFFRGEKKWSWKWTAITTVVIIAAFLINTAIFNLIALPGGSQTNNIGFGIYGLAVGGKGWEQIFVDHPELNSLSGNQFEQAVFKYIWEAVSTNPLNFIKGMLVQFKTLFSFAEANSMYSFAWEKNRIFSYVLITIIYLLSSVGVVFSFLKKQQKFSIPLLIFGLGFLASLIAAPAYQTRYMRVYAASIPFLGFLPAIGVYYLVDLLPERMRAFPIFTAPVDYPIQKGVMVCSLLLIGLIIFGPLTVRFFAPDEIPSTPTCAEDEDAVVMAYYPGSSIHIYRNDPSITTWVPILTQLDYKGSIHSICCDAEINYFKNIPVPNTMVPAVNLLTDKLIYMIVKEELLPDEYGHVQVCGRIEDVLMQPSESGFLYPSSIQLIN
jgi:hypothetical protein